jgi:protein involved in polysaccharide export with SLBB domain
MEIECPLKRALLGVALAFFAFDAAAAATRPQSSNSRVGPATDEAVTEGPAPVKKVDERAATRPADGAKKNDTRKNSKDAGGRDPKKDTPERASNATPEAPASAPPMTSDATRRAGEGATPPNNTPKSTLSAETDSAADPSAQSGSNPSAASGAPSFVNTKAVPPPVAPAPTSIYRVGVGDVLDIRLNNTTTRESTLYTVMAGGLIDYPLAGDPFNIAGMTTEEVGVRVAAELRRRAVFDKPQVFVSVREYASHTVLVSGLVYDPGVKILRREAIPLYVLIAEAQPKPEAGRALVMSHSTGQSKSIDLSDTQGLNTLIHPSDVVNLVARPQEYFYVGGEIAAPGQKDFNPGMTLTQALLASGGVTRAATGAVRVSRQSADGRLVPATYDLRLIQDGKVPDPSLQPGDRIEVVGQKKK